jgi:hypothetical protein
MQDRPTAHELLETIGDLLQGEVLAATSGPLKHQVRVAGNLCRILERELELQPASDAHAVTRIAALLGSDAGDRSLDDLNRELTARLRRGTALDSSGSRSIGSEPEDLEFERCAWSVLLEIVRDKLAVNKPGHDAYDFAPETSSEIER